MNNDELATRRAQAIAEDRCFSKERLRDEFRMKPAPGAEPVKWYKNTYGGRFAVYRIADCVPMREKRPLTSKQLLAGQRLSVLSRLNSTSGRMARQAYDWLSLAPLFLDTETTGLDNTAEALEIGLTDASGQVVFETRLKPTVAIGELPTYGYRRVWALLRRQAELDGMPAINAKRVYRIMRQNALLLERKPAVPPSKRAHTGRVAVKESNQRWCSDGFEFRCDNGEKLRVTFALDCCDREALHWAVTTGGFNSETVQDVMLGAVERRFGNELPASPVEWLTDNGSCYRANETRQFARMLGLEPKNTAMRSPESNGIAESFVKTIKRDYISIMPKPDGLTAAKNLAEAFEHYNEWHPHSALGYRSPREYLRQRACNGLSDNRCLEI